MDRQEVTLVYKVGDRLITVKAMDVVAPEDCFDMLMRAVLHRYVTGENFCPPISREVKDALIKQNLTI